MITTLILVPLLVGMFLAVNMGGSGTAPSFSPAYGANLISIDKIAGLFGLFVFIGAIFAGKNVALTLGKGILPSEYMTLTVATVILFSVAISLFLANIIGIPQSTSQSTVFALLGPAIYFKMLNTDKLFFEIIPTWFILPVVAFFIMLFIGKFIYPIVKNYRIESLTYESSKKMMKFIVVASSCYVAFAIGSNNVANASGPIASMVINELKIADSSKNFSLIIVLTTLIIAPCFGIGSSLLGRKVVRVTGKGLVDFGPMGATSISVLTASLLLAASLFKGIPTSLVQLNAAAILALGVSKHGWIITFSKTNTKKFFSVWIIAPLIALLLSYFLIVLSDKMGILYR